MSPHLSLKSSALNLSGRPLSSTSCIVTSTCARQIAHDEFNLGRDELDLFGQWVGAGDRVKRDATCWRIARLTSDVLEPLVLSADGWETLYRDPGDGRLWERTYPLSETHGVGPPRLRAIAESEASSKYPLPWDRTTVERLTVGRWAELYLAGSLSFDGFQMAVPEEPKDKDVAVLIDLIEHEPAEGGFFGVSAKEHDQYMAEIRELVRSLTEKK